MKTMTITIAEIQRRLGACGLRVPKDFYIEQRAESMKISGKGTGPAKTYPLTFFFLLLQKDVAGHLRNQVKAVGGLL